jgi:hypothetical protein
VPPEVLMAPLPLLLPVPDAGARVGAVVGVRPAVPWLEVLLVPLEPVDVPADLCVLVVEDDADAGPGSAKATAPVAARLATPTVAVRALSLERPRSRSATARERAACPAVPSGDPPRGGD